MKRLLFPLLWLALALTLSLTAMAQPRYTNPILHMDYSDPDVCRVGEDYYMTASSFNCFPGLPILHSRDLVHWTDRELISRPGWLFFNSSLTKGPDGYVLCMETNNLGVPFTCIFATSPDLVHWTYMDDAKAYPMDRYCGGPWMRYSRGYYYLILVTLLPGRRFTNYVCRTKDFDTWELGYYNPMLMPDEDDRKISPYMYDITPELRAQIRTGFISSNSDMDMCDWNGKTLITYLIGNQLGFYYMAEAEYDGCVADFLEACFS